MRRGDPSAEPLFAEMAQFLEKGTELQRLTPYAALMAERAWLGQGDRDGALLLIDRAESLAPTRAVFAELAGWRRILAPDRDPGDIAGMAEPYRLLLAGDWQAAAALWDELNAPYERALVLAQGDEEAQRT